MCIVSKKKIVSFAKKIKRFLQVSGTAINVVHVALRLLLLPASVVASSSLISALPSSAGCAAS